MKIAPLILLACAWLPASGENWPRFRGPMSMGVVEDPSLPETWNTTGNVKWKTSIPGAGWSSPVIWGDRIFVTAVTRENKDYKPDRALFSGTIDQTPHPDEHQRLALCIDFRTGKILWRTELDRGVPKTSHHPKNSLAAETPAVDGERVYVLFGNVGVFALDMNGKLLWKKALGPFPTRHGWGTAASPVAHGDKLFVPCDNDEASFLLALDKKTGKELWRVNRDEKSTWATPHVWVNEKRTELVTSGMTRMRSYDPETGKLLWELGGPMSHLAIPSPFSAEGLLYMTSGYTGDQARPVFAIRPGASGDITLKAGETSNEFVAWSLPQGGPYNVSPIVYRGIYYTFFDNAFITAHDARTGREIYSKRRIDETGTYRFTASPWAANGKLFALAEDGTAMVIQAGPEFKLLGKNLLDEQTLATPAISRGSLIIRTASQLYRISK